MRSYRLIRPVFAAFVVLLVLATLAVPAAAEVAGDDVATTTTTEGPQTGEIIPKPNSGVAPTDAGDRGGALQTLIFVLVLGGTGGMAVLVWRQSRKARAERGF